MYTRDRIKLLSDLEIDAIYSLPLFNETEQSLYFTFTDQEIAVARKYRTIKSQVYFMLSLGYFKAKRQFYIFDLSQDQPSQDARYVLGKYFDKNNINLSSQADYKTYQKQKVDILMLLGYHDWSLKYKPQIESHICELLRYYPKGHNALSNWRWYGKIALILSYQMIFHLDEYFYKL